MAAGCTCRLRRSAPVVGDGAARVRAVHRPAHDRLARGDHRAVQREALPGSDLGRTRDQRQHRPQRPHLGRTHRGRVQPEGRGDPEIVAGRDDFPEETAEERDGENEKLQAEIDKLTTQVQGEKAKSKRELDKAKEKLADLRKAITQLKRDARDAAEAELTEAERERARKEADAWAEEQGRKVLAGLSHLVVESIVGALEEAAGEMRLLIEQDAVSENAIRRIEDAKAGFDEEFNVARMSAATT